MTRMTRALGAALVAGAMTVSVPAGAEDEMVSYDLLTPDLAVELAQSVLGACREAGYQVAVVVVDRFGLTQAAIRDRFAGAHTVDTATSKAWTAASFRTGTLELDRMIGEGSLSRGLRDVPGALILGGGVPVEAAGSLVAAVGVSGAPGPELDEECAMKGLAPIAERISF